MSPELLLTLVNVTWTEFLLSTCGSCGFRRVHVVMLFWSVSSRQVRDAAQTPLIN